MALSVYSRAKKEPQAASAMIVKRRDGSKELHIVLPRNRWTVWSRTRLSEYRKMGRSEGVRAVFIEYPSLFKGKQTKRLVSGSVDWVIDQNGEMKWL